MGLVILLTIFPAGADVHYVNLSSTNPVPPFTDWSIAAIRIQDAVDWATAGDTVRIGPEDYYEQVVLAFRHNLTLAGEPGVVLHAFPGMVETLKSYGWLWYPTVAIYRSSGVVLTGLALNGEHLADLYTRNPEDTLPSRLLGVYFLGAGGEVTNCTLKGFRASSLEISTDANALHVLNRVEIGSAAVNVQVVDSTFVDNQFSMVLRGDPISNPTLLRTTITIKGNTIMGLGEIATPHNPHYGIWIVTGVGGEVTDNTLMNHGYSGIGLNFCSAIDAYDAHGGRPFFPLKPVRYERNTFSNNSGGLVMVRGDNSQVINNKFLGTSGPSWGALAISGANVLVADNNFADLAKGILLLGDESFGDGWPAIVPAVNPVLATNWFCNVPVPMQVNPIATGLQERGTETNCPFAPIFRSFTKSGTGEARALLRGWHGDTVTLEASTNLVDWAPVHTHLMELPTHECRDMNTDGGAQKFYRARQL